MFVKIFVVMAILNSVYHAYTNQLVFYSWSQFLIDLIKHLAAWLVSFIILALFLALLGGV